MMADANRPFLSDDMKTPIIEFKDFSFQYDAQKQPTLKNINLAVYPGEKILIVGLSGCGKSTLGNCINGLIPNVYKGTISGECIIDGHDISKTPVSELSKFVGTVLQDTDGQFVGLTVGEDIAFAMENDNIAVDQMHQRVNEIAQTLSIDNLLDKAPTDLSGGQKQRVSLAGVLVDDVDILLFDEPLANLDPASGEHTIELIDEIAQKGDKTIIIIEHRLEDVLHCPVDRILLIEDGRIISDSTPDELLSTDLLKQKGIREPLYLSALKYADVEIKKEDHPGSIQNLALKEADVAKLKKWVNANKQDEQNIQDVILKLDDISFSYDGIKKAVNHVSLDVHRNEILAIIGKNGAGKSTIARLLAGFMPLDEGRILMDERDIKDDTIYQRGKRIGMVLQNPNQMICNTMIFDEVAYGLRNSHIAEEEIKQRVEETLKICGLYPFRNWPISALSYGQKKRVTIASILVMKPDVIILDEPTAGQDYRHYTEIMTFLQKLNEEGNTLIIITHDMHLMLEYCHRSAVILEGEKIFDSSCAAVMANEDIIEKANLKKTSLYLLAEKTAMNPKEVTLSYINCERKERHESQTV